MAMARGGAKRVYGDNANDDSPSIELEEFAAALSQGDAMWIKRKLRERIRRINVDQPFDVTTPKINPWTPAGSEIITPLLYACAEGYDDVARVLIDNGANAFARSSDGNSLLHFSSLVHSDHFTREIADHRIHVDSKNHYGQTPLMFAAFSASAPNIDYLLRRGADPNAADAYGWTPLYYAVFYKQADSKWRNRALEAVAALVRGGARVTPEAVQLAQDYGEATIVAFLRSKKTNAR